MNSTRTCLKNDALKGRGLSRAARVQEDSRALAPEGHAFPFKRSLTETRSQDRLLTLAFVALALLLLSACSINVKKDQKGQDKQVDISSPVGGIHVSKGVNPEDVGIALYPGATLKEKGDGENKSANVNLSSFGFGLKVVALEYESRDSPEKVIAFYKDQLKRYGNVLVCHSSGIDVNAAVRKHDDSNDLSCEHAGGHNVELKVGSKDNQHIVAIEPSGSGSNFSLVYVRTHGKDAEI